MRRAIVLFSGAAIALGALLSTATASAYCRSNTCDPKNDPGECERDRDGCSGPGHPLVWASSCVTFAVQEDGSPKHRISEQRFAEEVNTAFQTWLEVDCGDGTTPSLSVENIGPVECDKVEYNQRDGNANVFMFRDEEWPYAGGEDALGLSTIRFDPNSGFIYDVDVEINGTDTPISVGDPVEPGNADLASILTHEVGHFLGLSHSKERGATMLPGYTPGDDSLRSLNLDDELGICDALNPDRRPTSKSCAPRHGFASDCGDNTEAQGCSTRSPGPGSSAVGLLVLGLTLGASRLRRARR
jgi:hypothetical protein